MARGDKTKAERKQARAAGGATKAERKEARASGGGTKAERKQARQGRKAAPGAGAVPDAPAEDSSPEERIEWRLARIEEAVAAQSQRSEELLKRVNEMLEEPASGES